MSKEKLTPEEQIEKEKAGRKDFNKAIYFGSFLYCILGIIIILISIIDPPIIVSFIFVGMAILVFAACQSLVVLLKEKISKPLKVILIIFNIPVYFLLCTEN